MSFSLQPADFNDIDALSRMAHDAFDPDRYTQLISNPRYGSYNHGKTMAEALKTWLARPADQCRVLKAVDDPSGAILGWIAWGFRGYDQQSTPNQHMHTPSDSDESDSKQNDPLATGTTSTQDETGPKSGIARLEELTSTDMQRWMKTLMPDGTKCMFIQSIVVAPKHQGKGVGSALVRYDTSQADQDGVFCWVHASEDGSCLFSKERFEEIGNLTVDMDRAAREEIAKKGVASSDGIDGSSEDVAGYGTYTFRYMKRLSQADSVKH